MENKLNNSVPADDIVTENYLQIRSGLSRMAKRLFGVAVTAEDYRTLYAYKHDQFGILSTILISNKLDGGKWSVTEYKRELMHGYATVEGRISIGPIFTSESTPPVFPWLDIPVGVTKIVPKAEMKAWLQNYDDGKTRYRACHISRVVCEV